jgi:soluble lytic murein transglycosylase-like protein
MTRGSPPGARLALQGVRAMLMPALLAFVLMPSTVHAGLQAEEYLSPSVATLMSRAISDQPAPGNYATRPEVARWIVEMAPRLAQRIPDFAERRDLLATVHYEAIRAGLDPQLMLGVIHHESGFKKYAVSIADARGYMQVMPFWTKLIGNNEQNLFHLRTNLRYGAVILRHYLDRENGDLNRALGRYNGSLGRSEYPSAVAAAMRRYDSAATATVPASVVSVTLGAAVPAK